MEKRKVPTVPNPVTIEIKIGSFTERFILVETNAPSEYDGHGAFTVYSSIDLYDKLKRWALIPEDHVEYHLGRYGSGLYSAEVVEKVAGEGLEASTDLAPWIREKLYRRLIGSKEDN